MKKITFEFTPDELLYAYTALNAMCADAWDSPVYDGARTSCMLLFHANRPDVHTLLLRFMSVLDKTEL